MNLVTLTKLELSQIEAYVQNNLPYETMRKIDTFRQYTPEGTNPNLFGILGEVVVHKHLGKAVYQTICDRPLHTSDLGFDVSFGDKRYDIKYHPKISKNQFINEQGKPVDGYILVNRKDIFDFCIMGWTPKSDLSSKGKLYLKGTPMPNGKPYFCNTWVIKTNKLRDFGDLAGYSDSLQKWFG